MVQRCPYCGKCYFEADKCPHCGHVPKNNDTDMPDFMKDIFKGFGNPKSA